MKYILNLFALEIVYKQLKTKAMFYLTKKTIKIVRKLVKKIEHKAEEKLKCPDIEITGMKFRAKDCEL